jgi:hypothetical protein
MLLRYYFVGSPARFQRATFRLGVLIQRSNVQLLRDSIKKTTVHSHFNTSIGLKLLGLSLKDMRNVLLMNCLTRLCVTVKLADATRFRLRVSNRTDFH